MKPRLYRRHGIWCCRRHHEFSPTGHGYTPAEAYRDWAEQVRHSGRMVWPDTKTNTFPRNDSMLQMWRLG